MRNKSLYTRHGPFSIGYFSKKIHGRALGESNQSYATSRDCLYDLHDLHNELDCDWTTASKAYEERVMVLDDSIYLDIFESLDF